MEQQTAQELQNALKSMDAARVQLEAATPDQVVAAAEAYQRTRETAGPAFVAAQREYDLAAAADPAATPEAAPTPEPDASPLAAPIGGPGTHEAAPGVPLVSAAQVVTPDNLSALGPLASYVPREGTGPVTPVQASTFALAAGVAVQTPDGEVATAQPSRIVVGADGLGVVPQDQFAQSYGNPSAPTPQSAPETPVEGAQGAPASPAAETPAEAPAAPQTPAEGSTPADA